MKKVLLFVMAMSLCLMSASCIGTGVSIGTSAATATAAPAASGPQGYSSPQTFKNPNRSFEYTIPAGWYLVDGEPSSEAAVFQKTDHSMSFIIHIEQMVPSFPRKAAVKAGLKQDKERVQINKLEEAVRRDDYHKDKKCGVIGWEQTEAPQKNGFQRIIWQAYDGENFYMNFNASTENENFENARPVLRGIMDSIKFCRD